MSFYHSFLSFFKSEAKIETFESKYLQKTREDRLRLLLSRLEDCDLSIRQQEFCDFIVAERAKLIFVSILLLLSLLIISYAFFRIYHSKRADRIVQRSAMYYINFDKSYRDRESRLWNQLPNQHHHRQLSTKINIIITNPITRTNNLQCAYLITPSQLFNYYILPNFAGKKETLHLQPLETSCRFKSNFSTTSFSQILCLSECHFSRRLHSVLIQHR